MPGPLILATSSCVSVGCYPEQDGTTTVILGELHDLDPGEAPAFEADLETPNRVVAVSTVEGEIVIKAEVSMTRTRMRIWLNDRRWPDEIRIGIDSSLD